LPRAFIRPHDLLKNVNASKRTQSLNSMGTSVNQPSKPTANWNAVAHCYRDPRIPIDQTTIAIWRAATSAGSTIGEQMHSNVIESCLSTAEKRPTREAALQEINHLNTLNQNSIVAEFAKRTLLISSVSKEPISPLSTFFRQVTEYLVSRDLPGFVGPEYRCKTVSEIREFKGKIATSVAEKVQRIESNLSSKQAWPEKVKAVIEKLQKP